MLHLFPLHHRGTDFTGIVFSYDTRIVALLKDLTCIRFSRTHRCYYMADDMADHAALHATGIPIQYHTSRPLLPQARESDTVSLPAGDTVDGGHRSLQPDICMNNNRLWIKMRYKESDIAVVRSLAGAYWNISQKLWSVAASAENLHTLQTHFNYWQQAEYTRIYELIMANTNPKILEIYNTPEYKNRVCLKLKGYNIDTHFVTQLADVVYEPDFRRWIVPADTHLIAALEDHYTREGARVFNRLRQKNVLYSKKDLSNKEKKQYLISKFPAQYSDLLHDYIDAMIRRNNSWNTIYTYVPEIVKFAQCVGVQNIAKADESAINQYLADMSGSKISASTVHTAINAIKYYYQKVIYRQDLVIEQIVRPKKGFRLPVILSTQEVNTILESVSNTKHIVMLFILYGAGLRLNELLCLQVNDIWWDRDQLIVRSGKGDKDRVVMLSHTLKQLLRQYFDEYMPQHWLFEGHDRQTQYSERSVQNVVKTALKKASITKKVSPHTLRHCFATHLLDSGVQLPYIQALLGHKDVKTTMIYTHVTTSNITNVASPLDGLNLTIRKP